MKTGGGAPGPPLCGILGEQWTGWDLDVEITEHHLSHSCKECVKIYREETNE